MKIALLGDTHFGARNDNPAFHKHFAKFYNEVFFPYLRENNIQHVVQLGDVFDRRKYINFNTFFQAREYFFDTLNKEFTSWLLVGNHDTYFKNTNLVNSPEMLLEGYHNINIVRECMEVEFEDVRCLLVPWWCEENDQRVRNSLTSTNATHVIGHFEIDGFEMYRGSIHQGGLTKEIFRNFEVVWSGHFHHQSRVDNIHYIGTPYEMTWSDFDDRKGFHIFDTDTRETTFVTNPYQMFHKIHYDDTDKQISEVVNIDFNQYSQTFVKLIVRNKTNPYCFDMFVDKLEKAGVYNVQVVDDHFHMDAAADEEITSEAEDTVTILTKFVQQTNTGVDKQQLTTLMMSLYSEALDIE